MKLSIFFVALFVSCLSFSQSIPHGEDYKLDNFSEEYGGKPEGKRFLHDHMVYPSKDLTDKTEGKVIIVFVINEEGKAINAKITQWVSPDIDKEAMRLFNMLEWQAAIQFNKPISTENSLEINFSVSKYKKWIKERGFDKLAYTDLPTDTSFAIYESADKVPSFSDPEKLFAQFIYTNLEYPEIAKRQNLEGNIVMSFIIEPDGQVSNIRIKKGVGGGCNEEATRVIGLTKWKPAVKNNKYVRFRMYYTMNFSVKNSFKDNSSGSQRTWGQ